MEGLDVVFCGKSKYTTPRVTFHGLFFLHGKHGLLHVQRVTDFPVAGNPGRFRPKKKRERHPVLHNSHVFMAHIFYVLDIRAMVMA
ncbi:MAG: hypothetical protein AB7E77_06360 [Desulfobulbus sp.]